MGHKTIPPPPELTAYQFELFRDLTAYEWLRAIIAQDTSSCIHAHLSKIAQTSYRFQASCLDVQQRAEKKYNRRRTEASLTRCLILHKKRLFSHNGKTSVTDRNRRYQHSYTALSTHTWETSREISIGYRERWSTKDGVTFSQTYSRFLIMDEPND